MRDLARATVSDTFTAFFVFILLRTAVDRDYVWPLVFLGEGRTPRDRRRAVRE